MIRFGKPSSSIVRPAPAALLALLAAGCRTNELPPSEWPPRDFRIEVFAVEPSDSGVRFRSFLVWGDGTALYREARRALEGVPDMLPIFRSVALYALDPRTTRMLSRELGRVGLLAPESPIEDNAESIGPDITIAWWARGAQGEVSSRQRDRGLLLRAVRVIDAYLPESCRFGDVAPDVERVVEAPTPLAWTEGALDIHVEVFQRRPVDATFLREVFALAIAARDWGIAADALRELEERGPEPVGGELVERGSWERDEIQPLRAVLARWTDPDRPPA